MAQLLYRLGQGSAKRAWLVISTWFVLLATTLTLMLVGGGKLSSSMTIDGLPSQQIVDQLKESFPEAGRGFGQVVFHKANGEKFTEDEKAAIAAGLSDSETVDGVANAIDPFATAADLQKQRDEVIDGKAKIEQAKIDLADGQAQIDAGKPKLAKAETDLKAQSAQLEAAIAQAEAAGTPAANLAPLLVNRAKIAAGFAEIEKQKAVLEASQAKINDGLAEIEANKDKLVYGEQLIEVIENFQTVSADGLTALATIQFEVPENEVEQSTTTEVVAKLSSLNLPNVQVEFSKSMVMTLDGILGVGEIIGLAIAAVVLFVMLGTLIAAGLPVLSAILGVGVSATATMALSAVIDMTSTTPVLGVMLGLAVGIDYSLFILNRHRKQLKAGMSVSDSIALANGTSGNAVLFAGLTVIIALVALNLTGIGFLGLMGTMGALSIIVAVAVALTFTPAILRLIGLRVLSKKERAKLTAGDLQDENEHPKNENRPVFVNRHPIITVLATVAVLLVAAIPMQSMRLGLPDGSSEPVDTTQYRAFKLTSAAFGEGFNGGVATVVNLDEPIAEDDEVKIQAEIATELYALDNVSAVVPAGISDDRRTLLFQVVPATSPASAETETLVYDIRELATQIESDYQGQVGVTGFTASNIDISQKLADALPIYLGTVILLSILLMILVFRSIMVPLLASAGFLLTVFATLGSVVAVYQWGWLGALFDVHDPGPILNFLPTILIGILFGLAMDYQLFLTSGMREAYAHGKSPKEAINHGIHLSRAVVVAAAIIMITVFGGFAFSHLAMIRPVGFGLAIGVLFDAFLVRLLLVPAAMSMLGNAAWWMPKWLDRILPDVDVEGAKLEVKAIR
ncbi:MMPL family transporter [Candidatus Rhodoluna planktonica]|uniref:RND transporter n=1 Tax=Candidatus Rhodoluna planktonica TaxID=535712 RepID=A0A1D9DXW6_9MICO|nr:MMPL family transporter [Candidatus Rhodoluna planktonica]AOY55647.1 RND transporter [Candidatus Rhodoluna planktonica]